METATKAVGILFLVAFSMPFESAVIKDQAEAEEWSLWKQVLLYCYKWLFNGALGKPHPNAH